MNYDQRIDYIKNWFRNDMLTRFTPPVGSNGEAIAYDIIEAVNSNIPSNLNKEQMDNILSSITKDIVQSARSRTVPIVKDFITSTRKCAQNLREAGSIASKGVWSLDPFDVAARRIRAGEAVSEAFLYGRQRDELMKRTGITRADLEKYIEPAAHKQ